MSDTKPSVTSDLPAPLVTDSQSITTSDMKPHSPTTFASYQLDRRILKSLHKSKFHQPTHIQQSVIPVALSGKDCIIKSKTGTGKTISYIIPIIQSILYHTTNNNNLINNIIYCIILVPTRELIDQVNTQINQIIQYCSDSITLQRLQPYDDSSSITQAQYMKQQYIQLQSKPNIIVTTPTQLLYHCQHNNISSLFSTTLTQLVIDEADLLLSYGYIDDMRTLLQYIPKLIQTILCSATMTTELNQLKKLLLHNPVVINVSDNPNNSVNTDLTQLYIQCNPNERNDKFLYVYTMLKLGLIKGKVLFYVNSIDSSYRLKLLLQQFSITSIVLNGELPYNTRQNTLQQFNKGMFDYLICTDQAVDIDENMVKTQHHIKSDSNDIIDVVNDSRINNNSNSIDSQSTDDITVKTDAAADDSESNNNNKQHKHKSVRIVKQNGTYGVTRGIDFHHVNVVINYEFPLSINSYIHRIGRTGRAGMSGLALSLVDTQSEVQLLNNLLQYQITQSQSYQVNPEPQLKLLQLNKSDLDGFRYRVDDISRSITKYTIRDARLAEIKHELINSTKLQAHFEDNPNELQLIQLNNKFNQNKIKSYLQHVPAYLLPSNMTAQSITGRSTHNNNKIKFHKQKRKFQSKSQRLHQQKKQKKNSDPLQSYAIKS